MIRVCVVAPKYMTGGQAVEAKTIVEGLNREPGFCAELQPIDPRLPSWLARLRGVRTIARLPLFYGGLIRKLQRNDVLHVCTAAFWPFLLTTTPAILLARVFGKPVILNYRDGRAPAHLRASWVRAVIRAATVVVFPSGFLRDVFARHGIAGHVIHNVVDTTRFTFRERKPLQPVLISTRLLERLYAIENTLRAFALVRAERPDARLIVLGGGDQEPMLRRIAHEEHIDGVEFRGAVPHGEVVQHLQEAHILVNSSREDNMPHVLIEALSCGLPVITTAAGGIPYIVEHERNALFVPMDEPAAMAAAVLRVLNDAQLAGALIEQGRRDCETRYAWEPARRSWTELYCELLRAPVPNVAQEAA